MGGVAARGQPLKAAPNNLPYQLTSFVGREADLRALKDRLTTARMVTLTGTGGIGKSRLAAEVAKASLDRWPDGALWIELQVATDSAEAVVTMLELPGRGSPRDVVASWLRSKRVLLILDNCEHLVGDCAVFCKVLLERCPYVSILATSREPIGVPGEARWPVPTLADTDALHLFEVRARLVRPDFSAKPQAETIARICERLDRLPLAIEMASARLDVMSEQELLKNLDDRFRLLASGARTAPERQQTMASTIDWSHRLLTPDEAQLFRRLAVFQGGFTLEAAQAVCTEQGGPDALGILTGLVQKSMVVADRLGDGSTRYRLLESHHDFARGKLVETEDLGAMQRRHYEYFATQKWRARESPNFWSALAWAPDNVADAGLALAVELAESEFSDQARMRSLLTERLERAPGRDAVRARGLNVAARLASRQADHVSGLALADASLTIARQLGDAELIANTLRGAGAVYQAAGQMDVSARMYDEALALLKNSADRRLAVAIQNQIGMMANERGDFANALEILRECVAFSRSSGDLTGTGQYLESLANAQFGVGDVEGAATSWMETLSICHERNDPLGVIWSLGGLALVAAARDEDERALRLAALVEHLSREFSFTTWAFRVKQLNEAVERINKKLGARKAAAVWNEAQRMNEAEAVEYALGEGGQASAAAADAGPLTRREREVASMVAAGMTNREIAQRLFIAERTAEGHVERIRNKLGVRSRTEVATWAVAHGLTNRQP